MAIDRKSYCEFLIASQGNYTNTYFADHHEWHCHDAINRYLGGDEVTGDTIWQEVRDSIEFCEDGCLIFDDTIIDKNHSRKIDLVKKQYSGNEHRVINGIGLVNCIYVNPHSKKILDCGLSYLQSRKRRKN